MKTDKPLAIGDPRIHSGVPELLDEKGFSSASIESLLALDLSMFKWRRIAEKGDFKGKMLDGVEEKLEPALMQGLFSIAQISAGLGVPAAKEPTIGMVADRMSIDPSRASRIVAGLVEKGFVTRAISQDDGRKSVLVLTPKSHTYLHQFIQSKWKIFATIFDDWEAQEIADFSRLFTRYCDAIGDIVDDA